MATTGEQLVSNSTLATGTALEHLTNPVIGVVVTCIDPILGVIEPNNEIEGVICEC